MADDDPRSIGASGLPRSPSGRIPKWVVDEVEGKPVDRQPWRGSAPVLDVGPDRAGRIAGHRKNRAHRSAGDPRLWRRRLARVFGFVAFVVVVGLMSWYSGAFDGGRGLTADRSGRPTPGAGASDEPLGVPPDLQDPSTAFRFLFTQDGSTDPVAYDPCRPIEVVMRPDNAPPGAEALIVEALGTASAVTGLQIRYAGTTDEAPRLDREPYQPDRYGDRWAPVLLAWVTAEENPDFAADLGGQAGSQAVGLEGGPRVYITGQIELFAPVFAEVMATPEGAVAARAVLLHEVGHLLGLAHVNDPSQLMYATAGGAVAYAAGDLTGLAALGSGQCVPAL